MGRGQQNQVSSPGNLLSGIKTTSPLSGPRGKLRRSQPRVSQVKECKEGNCLVWRRLSDEALHREDGPAVSVPKGESWKMRSGALIKGPAKLYYQRGALHRDGGPAKEYADGSKEWWLNNQLHREIGPAVKKANGSKYWYMNGKLHREDGPAIIFADGSKHWYLNDRKHREDGPAIEFAGGNKAWYLNGQRHREDGPAVEYAGGEQEWWLYNQLYSNRQEWQAA